MVQNVICIPGTCSKEEYYNEKYPTALNSHFFPFIQKQLFIRDIECLCMQHFQQYDSNLNYELWVKEFEKFNCNENSILVAHSSGCAFILRYLSENSNTICKKIILLAPYLQAFEGEDEEFYSYEIYEKLNGFSKLVCMYSIDDMQEIHKSINILENTFSNLNIVKFEDKGHFTKNKIGDTFPELLEEILK